MTPERCELRWISIDPAAQGRGEPCLLEGPFPPRDLGDISGLVSSIHLLGLISPILCRPLKGRLEVICGHRRLHAARAAGLKRIPAVVAALDDAEAIRCFLSENQERRMLDGRAELEANEALKRLRDSFGGGGNLQEASRRGIELGGDPRPVSRLEPAVARAPGASTGDAAAGEGLERLFARTLAFFEEARATRSINVPRTEILVDDVIEQLRNGASFERLRARRTTGVEVIACHGLLVTALAAKAAVLLGWGEDEARDFVVGSFLHDVGMVFITSASLAKAGSLSPEDRSQIQSHTRIGFALVSGAKEWRESVAVLARDHHERWNGTGYPRGLVGSETGRPARVLGLLDTFAAMIATRPHRDAIEPAHAVMRLEKALEIGAFDPSLGPLVTEVLGRFAAAEAVPMEWARRHGGRLPPSRNSVELKGSMTTMLAKGST